MEYPVTLSLDEIEASANKDVSWVQKWLNTYANTNLVVDGIWGEQSKQAFLDAFVDKNAKAITEPEKLAIAQSLGDVEGKRIRAIAKKESHGSGWFKSGRVAILWERHLMYNQMRGNKVVNSFINPVSGNYTLDANGNDINDSWEKLSKAIPYDTLAAFKSISIGTFQILGKWYKELGYAHPIEMLWEATHSEKAHYEHLAGHIKNVAKIQPEFLKIGKTRESCTPFALGYNGRNQAKHDYAGKLANIYASIA